jgi:hypothetical protein
MFEVRVGVGGMRDNKGKPSPVLRLAKVMTFHVQIHVILLGMWVMGYI